MKNKSLDRDYFKYKGKTKKKKGDDGLTPCCKQSTDYQGLNVCNEEDWERIEHHIERKLGYYFNTDSMTPVSCETCGRLLEYKTKLKDRKLY